MEEGLKALQVRSIELEGQVADWGIKLKAWNQHLPRILLIEGEYALAMQKAELEMDSLAQLMTLRQGRYLGHLKALAGCRTMRPHQQMKLFQSLTIVR